MRMLNYTEIKGDMRNGRVLTYRAGIVGSISSKIIQKIIKMVLKALIDLNLRKYTVCDQQTINIE